MATAIEAKITNALMARMAALTFSPAIPVAWPNVAFTPPSNNRWLRVNEIPASTTPFALSGGTSEHVGLMQIDVFRPLNEGHLAAKETAGAVRAHFLPPLKLYSEGVTVKITRAEIGPVMRDGPHIMLPVTIRYRAFGP